MEKNRSVKSTVLLGLLMAFLLIASFLPFVAITSEPVRASPDPDDWWDSDWQYKKVNPISGSTAGAQENYQMRMRVHAGTGTDNSTDVFLDNHGSFDNFQDVRWVQTDNVECDFWIENFVSGDYADFWAEIPSIPVSPNTVDVSIYYGNSDATSASNGDDTFKFFDHFPDATKWNLYSGASVHDSLLDITHGSSDYSVEKTVDIGDLGIAVEALLKVVSRVGPNSGFDISINTTTAGGSDGAVSGNWYLVAPESNGRYKIYQHVGTTYTNIRDIAYSIPLGSFDRWTIKVSPDANIKFYLNDSLIDDFTDATPITDDGGYLAWREGNVEIDWVAVRKYTSPEPTWGGWGSEETSGEDWLSGWDRRKKQTITGSTTITYGSDFLIGGTASASSEWNASYVASYAFDDSEGTRWSSQNVAHPHWIKYDLGSGVTKTARKLRLKAFTSPPLQMKDFKLQGSNNDTDWDDILSTTAADSDAWQEWAFSNSNAYRYYRIFITSTYYTGGNQASIWEIELMEGQAETNYQMRMRVHKGTGTDNSTDVFLNNNCRDDFGDIRWTENDGTATMDYWVETVVSGDYAEFWIEIPSVPASPGTVDVYLYYDNPSATSVSSGTNTFDFFDGFPESSIDTSKWTIVNATGWSVAGGELKGTNTSGRIQSISTFSEGVIQEAKVRTISLATNGQMVAGFYISSANSIGFLEHPTNDYYRNNGNWVSIGNVIPEGNVPFLATVNPKTSTSVYMEIKRLDTGAVTWSGTLTNTVSSEPIVIGKRYDDGNTGQGYETYWDWIRIRKYSDPEPTWGDWGSEETTAAWNSVETWTGRVSGPEWHLLETWVGTVTAPANWNFIETWTGTVSGQGWQFIETWAGTVEAPAEWQLIGTWTGAVSGQGWQFIEEWEGSLTHLWWDLNWTKRRCIDNLNPNDNQIFVVLEWAGITVDDLRFLEEKDENELNFWIENYTSSSVSVWVDRSGGTDNEIWVYYGNPSVSSASLTWYGRFTLPVKTVPTDWSENSSFEERFPRASTTYGSIGGSTTHSHSFSFTTSTSSVGDGWVGYYEGYTVTGANHTHSKSGNVSSSSHIPPYLDLVFVSFTQNTLPKNIDNDFALMMNSLPGGWSTIGEAGEYLRGNVTYGGTGGSTTHSHTYSGSTGGASTTSKTSHWANYACPTPGHYHNVGWTTPSRNNEPPYFTVILACTNAEISLPFGMLGIFDNLPPLGWGSVDFDDRFPKIGTTYGDTGGSSATHSHTYSGTTGVVINVGQWYAESGAPDRYICRDFAKTHTHTYSGTTGSATPSPPYLTVIYGIRNSPVSVPVIEGEETTAAWNLVETWTGAVSSQGWQFVETWTSSVSALADWNKIEEWTSSVSAPADWKGVEIWTGTVNSPEDWHLVETWEGTVRATKWILFETWTKGAVITIDLLTIAMFLFPIALMIIALAFNNAVFASFAGISFIFSGFYFIDTIWLILIFIGIGIYLLVTALMSEED